MSSIGRKSGRFATADINLRCQKQCNAICETEKGRRTSGGEGGRVRLRTVDAHRTFLPPPSFPRRRSSRLHSSGSLFLFLPLHPQGRKGRVRAGERRTSARGGGRGGLSRKMEGREILPVINFGVLIKNARAAARGSSASSFFSFHSRSSPPLPLPLPSLRPLAGSDSGRNVALCLRRWRVLKIARFAENARSSKLRDYSRGRRRRRRRKRRGWGGGKKGNKQEI